MSMFKTRKNFTYTTCFYYILTTIVQYLHSQVFLLFFITRVQSLHFYIHTLCFWCYVYKARVQCLHFYLHTPRVLLCLHYESARFTLLFTYTTSMFVIFTSRERNIYTFIFIHHMFLLFLHHGSAMFTILFTHTTCFCYVYISELQCLHFYSHTPRVFCYVYLTRVQCLHFYLHTPSVFVMFISR
jgi:hypothetical protein